MLYRFRRIYFAAKKLKKNRRNYLNKDTVT